MRGTASGRRTVSALSYFKKLQSQKLSRQAKRAQRVEITADRVVAELAKIAFADPRDLMEWGPSGVKFKNSADLMEEQAASVAEVTETITQGGGSIRLKKYDKLKALELLGKHLGMFERKMEGCEDEEVAAIEVHVVNGRREA